MVGRFVQNQQFRRFQQQTAELQSRLFTARHRANGLVIYAFKAHTVEDGFDLNIDQIAIILGELLDSNMRRALIASNGSLINFVTRPIAIVVLVLIIFSLFMAVLLNQKMIGRAAFRAIFFIPVILATGLMQTVEAQNILGSYMDNANGIDDGSGSSAAGDIVSVMDIERLFANMKVGTELMEMAVGWINNIYDIVNRSGVQMLIFLAGLQSISPAIYEACRIDGCTSWETFWKITFPMISPMILVNGIYTIIDSFTTDSNTVMKYINSVYQGSDGQVLSSAMAWMYFLIVMLMLAIAAGLFSAFVFYQKRD